MSKETQNKKSYLAPSWRVVSFKTERGAFLSLQPTPSSAPAQDVAGDELEEQTGFWPTSI